MTINEQLYLERYSQLNEAQQLAVDTIYGPVMVIAGPGTGKTEVLSMRIANLLRSDAQVTPNEILCLTYTEEAAFNMRKRLLQIIGNAAHKVNINTFHGFCNSIIQANMEYFGVRNLDIISDLERAELMQSIIDSLPAGHPMHRIGNSIYYDIASLNSFFTEMKKENWTGQQMQEAVQNYLDDLPTREQYLYKRASGNYKKGDLKQNDIDAEKEKMQRTLAAATLFGIYNNRMKELGRYDFSDMILWVIDVFKKNTNFLQRYQEQFQYIMVDEFQDTNGAQNELLTLLTNYWEDPNIFVVGDDDQSIYEFQGARIRNIIDFYERHKTTVNVIVLTDNYRSSQPILNKATQSITSNKQRLVNAIQGITFDKNIVAASSRFTQAGESVEPVITSCYNLLHEEILVMQQIEELQQKGVDLSQVAVIYSQHKQADNIISMMERKSLPYSIRKNINVLDTMLCQQILKIFRYLNEEKKSAFSAEDILFEILHAPYFNIDPNDLALLSLYLNSKEAKEKKIINWRILLSQELLLSTMSLHTLKEILHVARLLDNWLQQMSILTLPMLLEKIVYDSGIVSWLLKGDEPVWQMQVLQTLFAFIKETCAPKPQTTLAELLYIIEKMQTEKIELSLQRVVQQEKGVHFYTAHSAKGNEFEYVFLIGCTKDFWENKSAPKGIKFPDTLTRTVDENDSEYKTEVARRLFYVAMTRAKKYLFISYARQKNDGKPLQASMFVDEISTADERIDKAVPTSELIAELEAAMKPVPDVYIKLVNRDLLVKQLEHFMLSASSLSKYLKCPVRFYYEDILRTPVAENDSMAFGIAIHYALERTFREMLKSRDKTFPPLEEAVGYFRYMMREKQVAFTQIQYERRLAKGIEMLSEYYTENVEKWPKDVELEKWVQSFDINGIPLKGKIDKIEKTGIDSCRVIDYKTGNPDTECTRDNLSAPNDKLPDGGDYWRQIVFYKILLESQPFNRLKVTEGLFEYIEKSKKTKEHKSHKVFILPSDEAVVSQQIKDSYTRIKNIEFERGCGEEDCTWCTFVKNNNIIIQEAIQ